MTKPTRSFRRARGVQLFLVVAVSATAGLLLTSTEEKERADSPRSDSLSATATTDSSSSAWTTESTTHTVPPPHQREPKFDPPPLPELLEDQGIYDISDVPEEPGPLYFEQEDQRVDRHIDDRLGLHVPKQKRDALKRNQADMLRGMYSAERDYYAGNIDRATMNERIHRVMLSFAQDLQTTLTPNEYRKYTDLEPGQDPWIALVPPTVEPSNPP